MNNSKKFKVIGIMSGTSMDGIDFAYLETNGINYTKNYIGQSYKYPIYYKNKLRAFIKKIQCNSNLPLKIMDKYVSDQFIKMINKFINDFKIDKNEIDYLGLSGQTVLHKPNNKISIQLSSGKYLAKKLKLKIVCDFRQNDILNGGQGAPIGSFYYQYILNKIGNNIAIINLGGISNICYSNKKKLIAFDTGPANALIDDYMFLNTKKQFDNNGRFSKKGNLNKKILNEFLNDNYFKLKYPKSLDRDYFNHYIEKVKKLRKIDAAHTLSMMTVYSIKKGIDLLNKKIDKIILTGGGRKNLFFFNQLKKITKIKIINIDDFDINGDLLEAEAFGYLAVRSVKKLPLSLKTTTGVKKPTTGGKLFKFN